MNMHRVVGGRLTRDAVLRTLLLNYADRLQHRARSSGTTSQCFLIPDWVAEPGPIASPGPELFVAEVHTSHSDPRPSRNLDVILDVLDGVLTQPVAGEPITARFLQTSPRLRDSDAGTVFKTGVWAISPAAVPVSSEHDGGLPPLASGGFTR